MGTFQVDVVSPSADRIAFVKALRTIGEISLKRASDIANHLDRFRNSTVVAGVEQRTAEHIAATLVASGSTVVVRESTVSSPTICCPEANHRYEWGGMRRMARAR
jgi:ribosomal protein L7/L12